MRKAANRSGDNGATLKARCVRRSEVAIALVFVCRGQSNSGLAIDHLQTKLATSLKLRLPLYARPLADKSINARKFANY